MAADWASERETEVGSFPRDWAVRRADCFWARVVPVPWVGEEGEGEGEEEGLFRREKRVWNSLSWFGEEVGD